MRNITLAVRMLLKTPFVTAIAVLSLALGIGANAAIFSMFDQLLRRPLPVREPGRLANLAAPGPKPGSDSCNQSGGCDEVFSYAMFRDLEKSNALEGLAAHRLFGVSLSIRNEPMTGEGSLVSGSYFPVLGLNAAHGRLLTPDDDRVLGAKRLKAVLRIPESQAKDVALGQKASVDTRNGFVSGHVTRKDPSAQGGSVTVDVTLDGALPPGAVPDLSVIEIVRGLAIGDKIIVSDMSQYANSFRVRIK